ncbi:MAG: alpha/beta fold hydrolase [Nanoarchaeota archaeon]
MKKKSPLQNIEKDVKKVTKNVEKHIKRNWKKIILIIVISFIILSSASFLTGLRIKFALKDELIINLNPESASFNINNDQNQNITFYVSTDNSIFCTAWCEYVMYDRSEERLLHNDSRFMKNKDSFEITYELEPYRIGSGQKIYNFDIQCANKRTFLCSTKSPAKIRSSFVTLNYKLTDKEANIKTELKPIISQNLATINNASKNLQLAIATLNKLTNLIEHDTLYRKYLTQSLEINKTLIETEKIVNLWAQEKYAMLGLIFKNNIDESLIANANSLLADIEESINKQNLLIKEYNSQKNKLLTLYDKYTTTEEINNIIEFLNMIQSRNYKDITQFEKDILVVIDIMDELNKSIEKIKIIGQNLTIFEYSKKCSIGYCENVTNDVCQDLKDIITEYNNSLYNGSSNESYYEKMGNLTKIIISNRTYNYYIEYCIFKNETEVQDLPLVEAFNLATVEVNNIINNELTETAPFCCVYGECRPCCRSESCENDPELYPVLLIHGHSLLRGTSPEPVLDGFNKIQYQLQNDGYVNSGVVRFSFNVTDAKEKDWGFSSFPIVVTASYYYDYFYSVGKYIYITKSSDNLDTYVIRLNDIINLIKYRTGKPKINIIAHSMGGLVARRYLQIFSEESVNKMVLIATPNKGITGDVKRFCQIFGEKKECEDMSEDSLFLRKLNSPLYTPKNTKVYTISGSGCMTADKDGDGVVTIDSSKLDYAESFIVEGSCDDIFSRGLHSDLLNIDKYPLVYEDIDEILND